MVRVVMVRVATNHCVIMIRGHGLYPHEPFIYIKKEVILLR